MQRGNPIFDDLARVASGAFSAFGGVRDEVETRFKDRVQRILRDMDVVTREEFAVVEAMAAKAREENERLAARVQTLEAALAAMAARTPAKKTTGPAKPAPGAEGGQPG